jgi:pre-rRNA-processing protein TSR4
MSNIDLGFAQQIETQELKWKLKNKYFPSKIGGKLVFLDLKNIPQTEDLECGKCGKRLRFLLRIYAPIETQIYLTELFLSFAVITIIAINSKS